MPCPLSRRRGELSVNVTLSHEDDWFRIKLAGEIDLYNVYTIKDQVKEKLKESPSNLSVDVSEINYLDSSGIGMLVELKRMVEETGKIYRLRNIPPNILQLFKAINLDKILKDNIE